MKGNLKYFFYTLFFLPIFLTPGGIYYGVLSENNLHLGETGLVIPLIFFFGLYSFLIVILNFINDNYKLKVDLKNILLLAVIIYTLLLAVLGFGFYNNVLPILRYLQFISFMAGLFIFTYLFQIKKLNFESFFKNLFYFLLLFIIFHYAGSVYEIGLVNSLKSIGPNVFFFGIYQSRVYYPYLILCLFFFSINFINSKYIKTIGITMIIFYIFSLQVRGAMVSLIVYLILYLLIKIKNKIFLIISIALSLILLLNINSLFDNFDLGRFGDVSKFKTFNGRLDLWLNDIETSSVGEFFFGNLFYDMDNISSHNQYINFYVYGGVLLLILFLILVIYICVISIKSYLKKRDNINPFIFSVFFVPVVFDLNLNVPLNNINSTIIYTFVWSSLVYYLKIKGEGSYEKIEV